jgi:hypothetical protein
MGMHPVVPAIVLALAIVRMLAGGVSWLTFVSIPLAMLWLVVEIRGWTARRESEDSDAAPPAPVRTPEQAEELRTAVDMLHRMRETAGQRPAVPSEEQIRATAQPAIYVHRSDLAVPLDHPARSYLGGLPRLPAEMPWPEIEKHERFPLTFLAQIDLAELPVVEASPLPRSGTLYFFADTHADSPEPTDCSVLYYAGDTARVPIRDVPAGTRAAGDDGGTWPWLPQDSVWARAGFRFPLTFSVFDSYRDYTIQEGAKHPPTRNRSVHEQLTGAEFTRRFGAPAAGAREILQRLWKDGGDWPFAWIVVEYAARALAYAVERATAYRGEDVAAALRATGEGAAKWIARAGREEPCAPCDAATQAEFLQEWRSLVAEFEAINRRLQLHARKPADSRADVVIAACHACASHGAADVLPPVYRDALAQLNDPRGNHTRHQMLGHGEKVQSAPIEYRDQILLLQLMADTGLGWHPGGGCALQFWVDPAAAARAAFDAVAMTLECD